MCGKKLTSRDGGPDQSRKQFIDTSLFYWEYLNNSLNYILSGANDLDHVIQFDNPALKQIIATDVNEESVHFIERTKLMKTRCDPANYLKDIQEYGDFINYDLSRTNHQEIMNIEEELAEEFDLGLLMKRLRKKYRKMEEKMTVYQVQQLHKQMKNGILNDIVDDQLFIGAEYDRNLDQNRLYRELFNIQENQVKEEKVEPKRSERHRPSKAGRKKADEYHPSSSKYKDVPPPVEKIVPEEKIKKEENTDKNPIRHFPSVQSAPVPIVIENIHPALAPQPAPIQAPIPFSVPTPPPMPMQMPVARSQPNNIIPFTPPPAINTPKPPISLPTPPPIFSITPSPYLPILTPTPPIFKPAPIPAIEKIEPMKAETPQPAISQKFIPRENQANPSSNVPSAEPFSKATDSQKKPKKAKKIDKDKEKEKKKPKTKAKQEKEKQKQPKKEKRPYVRKQPPPPKPEDIKIPAQIAQLQSIIPINTFERRPPTSCVEIGIQADGTTEDFQSLKVIVPRQTQSTFTFTAIKTVPSKKIEPEKPPEEDRRIIPEPMPQPAQQINLLSNSNEFERQAIPPLNASSLLNSQRMQIEHRQQPSPFQQPINPAQAPRNQPQRKKDDFNIDDYLI